MRVKVHAATLARAVLTASRQEATMIRSITIATFLAAAASLALSGCVDDPNTSRVDQPGGGSADETSDDGSSPQHDCAALDDEGLECTPEGE
jgi:hypothetical protein